MKNLNPNKEHIFNLIIIDESGSMSHLTQATLSGVNETINTIRSAQQQMSETQQHFLTLVTFDTGNTPHVRTLLEEVPIEEVQEFSQYHPNGGTPLYDAIGQSLVSLHAKVENDEKANVVVTIISDGMENSSVEYTGRQIKALIERMKQEGWSFSYMGSAHDVKGVTIELSIDNFIMFDHDERGARSSWEREMSAKRHYFESLHRSFKERRCFSKKERADFNSRLASEYYGNRVTPESIDRLEPNQVFVFGSNIEGHHAGGASYAAKMLFGAVEGQAEGLQGQSYAIPTVGISLMEMAQAVERFIAFAREHSEQQFLVTAIGCGNAGYRPSTIAALFSACVGLENVALPPIFWKELGLSPKEML